MRIDIDLDDDRIVSSPGVKSPVTLLQFKRDTSAELQVRFWSAGIQTALPAGAAGKFGIKPVSQYDTTPLVAADAWTLTGSGATAVYTFAPDFNGASLAALLGSGDGNTANDLDSVAGILEIFWLADGKRHRTQTVPVIIANDVIKDSDATPLTLATPSVWLEAHSEAAFLIDQARQQLSFATSGSGVFTFVTKQVSALTFSAITTSTGYWRFRKTSGSQHTQNTQPPAETTTSGHHALQLISCTTGGTAPSGNIQVLNCNYNNITRVDVAGLVNLTQLYCSANQLQSLDLTGLTALTTADCSSNQISNLVLTGTPALNTLICSRNRLTSLDLSAHSSLEILHCFENQLTHLDVSSNTILAGISCHSNRLTGLDIAGLVVIYYLDLHNNLLSAAAVDAIMQNLWTYCLTNSGTVDVSGTGNAAPTSASLTVREALIAQGWTVTTN